MTATSVPNAGTRRVDDMHDTQEELDALENAPILRFALATIGGEITPAFLDADRKALQHQSSYRRITLWATTFGTISIVLSIGGLAANALRLEAWESPILVAQSITLLITAAAVLKGLFAYRHENWLLERCRAEKLRTLKFSQLLDPALWNGDERERLAWADRVRTEVERARALRHQDVAVIAGQEEVPGLKAARILDTVSLEALASYYERKRLGPQREYFLAASRDSHHFGAKLLPLVFFGAVFLEVIQTVLSLSGRGASSVRTTDIAIMFSAASIALPALWAGYRTQQGSGESSRNAARSQARHNALMQLSDRMLAARSHPAELLWTMRLTEFVLQVDQREWLRLLREVEWYG